MEAFKETEGRIKRKEFNQKRIAFYKAHGLPKPTPSELRKSYAVDVLGCRIFVNDLYQVMRYDELNSMPHSKKIWPDAAKRMGDSLIWLSIRRLDRKPIHDWRDLQEIKNLLVGPEHDAMELYPKESRVMDTANQYHLWVLKDCNEFIPIGWPIGFKSDVEAAGSKQRSRKD
tara:strand:+ start:117 stop:632 length:516 start_codon:yes stop_codon:yes gene_type:complete